ncbi:hypothetical protein D3C71_1871130 [compost metagenome]
MEDSLIRSTLRPSSSETASCSPQALAIWIAMSAIWPTASSICWIPELVCSLWLTHWRIISQLWLVTAFAWLARACRVSMMATISPVEAWVRPARVRTSSATTAKPRPCSPARAASMAALSASRLV